MILFCEIHEFTNWTGARIINADNFVIRIHTLKLYFSEPIR